MIPKIIHWCWLSNDPLPKLLEACIQSWKEHLPDYEIKLWNMSNFDVNSVPYVSDAVKARKWAFACDYIRAYALYTEGGIYMDSDIFVRKNFDFVLNNRAFSAMEIHHDDYQQALSKGYIDPNGNKRNDVRYIHGSQIQAAILGSEKGHPFFRDVLDYYETHSFIKKDGSIDTEMIAPFIYANQAIKYGFRFIESEQKLAEGFMVYGVELCAPVINEANKNSFTVHCCKHSWADSKKTYLQKLISNIKIKIYKLIGRYRSYDERVIEYLYNL